jgi:DNA-binding NtrC family response regulator
MHLFCRGTTLAAALPFSGGVLELGRDVPAPGRVDDGRMSRRHARVRFDGQRFWVTDLGSQNGTSVDGAPLPPGAEREALQVIRMGDSLFVPSLDVRPLQTHGVKDVDGHVRGPALQLVLQEVARAARLDSPVHWLHIHGESGTGKEGVARAFHNSGPRGKGPFVAVNCATIKEELAERLLFGARKGAYSGIHSDAQGHLQAAHGGTLFLDELVELAPAVQAALLRALETREVLPLGATRPETVDVRFCSATNKDLRTMVESGRLRGDLYYRAGRTVSLPPLRQRPEEIPLLLEREARRCAPGLGLHVSLVEACLLRPWPGNVRELLFALRNALQDAQGQSATRVEARHLGPGAGTAFGSAPPPPGEKALARASPQDDAERSRLEEALRQQGGNVSATARALGLHRTQLRRLMERLGLSPPKPDAP